MPRSRMMVRMPHNVQDRPSFRPLCQPFTSQQVLSTLGEHPDYAIAASEMEAALKNRHPDRSVSVICQTGEKSATRGSVTDPRFQCATSARRAFYVQVVVPMRLPDAGRLYGQLRQSGDSLIILCGTDRV